MNVPLNQPLPPTVVDWQHLDVFLRAKGAELALNLLAALVILIIGWWGARWINRISRAALLRTKLDQTVATFIADFSYAFLLVFIVVSALGRLGLDTTSFAAVIAAAGLAIGLALQGSLSNLASGIIVIAFKPFRIGDSIEVGTSAGTVQEVRIFSTLLRTADNVQIIIPNSQITQAAIKNYSVTGVRRADLMVSCGYDDDVSAVKRVVEELLLADERILRDPKPTVSVDEFKENGIQLAVRPWVKTADYGEVRSDLAERIKAKFAEQKFHLGHK